MSRRFKGDVLLQEMSATFGTTVKQTRDLLSLGQKGTITSEELDVAMRGGRERAIRKEGPVEELGLVEESKKRASDVIMDNVGKASFQTYQMILDKVLEGGEFINKGWGVAAEVIKDLTDAIRKNTDSQKSLVANLVDQIKISINTKINKPDPGQDDADQFDPEKWFDTEPK